MSDKPSIEFVSTEREDGPYDVVIEVAGTKAEVTEIVTELQEYMDKNDLTATINIRERKA